MGDGGGEGQRFSISIGPTVAVGVLQAVRKTVSVRVGVVRIGDRTGGLSRAVVTKAQGADSGDRAGVFRDRVEGRIQITNEVFISIAVGIRRGIGSAGAGVTDGSPADLQRIGQTVAVGIGAIRICLSVGVGDMHVPVVPIVGIRSGKALGRRFVSVRQAIVVAIPIRDSGRLP